MKRSLRYIDEFRNPELVKMLVDRIKRTSTRQINLMEFCGGHTVAILRFGIRQLLPPTIKMLSGPGCPVCVTDNSDLDKAVSLARAPGTIIATFGDLIRVPSSYSSLQQEKAAGSDVRVVYSTMDALEIAESNPEEEIVFLGIGFETTAPTVAASILEARRRGIRNYSVLSMHKLCPPVTRALLRSGEVRIDGMICPGHVSAVIGSEPWDFFARDFGIGGVVSGFEPVDILQAIEMLVKQIERGAPAIEIAYTRGVKPQGNREAQAAIYRVFEVGAASWRGIGAVPGSGLLIKPEFQDFDAEKRFTIKTVEPRRPKGCICGDVLRAVKIPSDCRLFGKTCTPDSPVGPCMVSAEGSCAAHYRYEKVDV